MSLHLLKCHIVGNHVAAQNLVYLNHSYANKVSLEIGFVIRNESRGKVCVFTLFELYTRISKKSRKRIDNNYKSTCNILHW